MCSASKAETGEWTWEGGLTRAGGVNTMSPTSCGGGDCVWVPSSPQPTMNGGMHVLSTSPCGSWNAFLHHQYNGNKPTAVTAIAVVRKVKAVLIIPDHLQIVWTLPAGNCDSATRWMLFKEWLQPNFDYDKTG